MITWTVAHQAPPSMESSGQEYWGGLLFPSPGVLDPVTEPTSLTSPALASRFFANCATWEALKPPCAYPHLFWLPLSDHPHPQLLQVWTLSHHVYVRWSCPDRIQWAARALNAYFQLCLPEIWNFELRCIDIKNCW